MKTIQTLRNHFGKTAILLGLMLLAFSVPSYAHCDSYDGPVIKDAQKALAKQDVSYVLKWIEPKNEAEITNLFKKTVQLKSGDAETYSIVEKSFFETLVRLHRESEGAPYTGLKPAGSAEPIVKMADNSIEKKSASDLLNNLGNHIQKVITEKFDKVNALAKVKDNSVAEGRAYVAAYVDYTHTLEGLESLLAHGAHH
jgi:hypothetical protein